MPADEGQLSDFRVAIVGLGLMGGSLGLALRGRCAALYGVDPDPSALSLAMAQGVVARAASDPKAILPEADVVILAAPVGIILDYLVNLPELHPGPAIVLDIGSTKGHVTQAMQALPSRFDPVGGHPMCGKEVGGLANAEASIFQGATFAFTPLERTSRRARSFCGQLAAALGAIPLWLDASSHDRWTASTSHLPYLLANTLAAGIPIESAPLIGPGFRSTARLAVTSPRMMRDILATNQENVLTALARFKQRLDQVEALISQGNFDTLEALLEQGAEHYQAILSGRSQ